MRTPDFSGDNMCLEAFIMRLCYACIEYVYTCVVTGQGSFSVSIILCVSKNQ